MSDVSFAITSRTITIKAPSFSNVFTAERLQVSRRAAGGDLYVYDKDVKKQRMELVFEWLDDTEKTALETFFQNKKTDTPKGVRGQFWTFTYTDHEGATWTARFLQTSISFTEIRGDRWNCRISLEVVAL